MADKLTETVERLRDAARWLVDHASHHGSYAAIDQDQVDGLRDAVNAYDLAALTPAGEDERAARPLKLTMPNGDELECDYPTGKDWARSWTSRDQAGRRATGEQDWEIVETYGLTAILEAALSRPNVDEMQEALECARIKLARYREQHGDRYIGGVAAEYDAVVSRIDAALNGSGNHG